MSDLAKEVADKIGAVLCNKRCEVCSWPMFKFASDPIQFEFCWNCQTQGKP